MKRANQNEDCLDIFQMDPLLQSYKTDINLRMDKYSNTKKVLLGRKRKLKSICNGHLYFGFHPAEEGWFYREWAPGADELHLLGDFNNWNPESHPLKRCENGCWEIFIPGADALKHMSLVKIRIKSRGLERDRIPLYIRRTVQDSVTHEFIGQIWQPENSYNWTDKKFQVDNNSPLLIYEAHIGMAQEKEGIGTYKEFTKNILPRVKESGYNAIQLMGIMNHPYYGSFGYHVSNYFAVSSWFGNPEDLKDLINTAHSMGITVLMDLVHSHAVKNIADGINEFDGTDFQFFHTGERGYHKVWDSKLFNYGKHEVMHFLLSNIKFWMEEYHFDGFRFDGVTSMIYLNHGIGINFDNYDKYFSLNADIDALNYLQLANELVKEIRPDGVTIAEEVSGMPGMCLPLKDGGIGFDYRLAMGVPDFWINTVSKLSDEHWSMWKIWYELTNRRPHEKSIGYVESHDQAMVGDKTIIFRLADKEMYWHMSKDDENLVISRAIDLHKLIRFATITLSGEGYLNFMGNEFGHPEWIDFPREGNNWSHKYARRQWSLSENQDLKYDYLYTFDKLMLDFVKENNVMRHDKPMNLWTDEKQKLLAFKKNGLIFLFNFNPVDSFPSFELPLDEQGTYRVVFNSDDESFGGQSRISQDINYDTKILSRQGKPFGISIYTPSRTVLVLRKNAEQ